MYKRLQTCVSEKRINKKEMAEEVKMNYQTLLRKIAGKTKFTLDEAVAVHKYIKKYFKDISIEELFQEG